ncbi:MAG: protease complex subunit PrcB family protein [Lachnospiraceae bacterium]
MCSQKKLIFNCIKPIFLIFFLISLLYFTIGCEKKEEKKTSSVDFTIVTESDMPKDLKKLIKERRKNPFELSYSDGSYLYIIKGYGKQETSDYSIIVNDFYLSGDNLVFDTDLTGPGKDGNTTGKASYPYIVIKTEYIENSIIFQ